MLFPFNLPSLSVVICHHNVHFSRRCDAEFVMKRVPRGAASGGMEGRKTYGKVHNEIEIYATLTL